MTELSSSSNNTSNNYNGCQINPSENFNFKKHEEWENWIKWFERFIGSSKRYQVNMLIYCMGAEPEDVLAVFNISEEEQNNYTTVK